LACFRAISKVSRRNRREVAREINHLHRTKKKKLSEQSKGLEQELVDVIFTCCCIANNHNIDLELEWNRMMSEKHYVRDNQRYERK
jgi:NTP pyrophosphatase (non-canonical NTP hydrolase)